MKREIKFRGLRTDGKGWVYGDLVTDKNLNGVDIFFYILTESAITFEDITQVIPETVCQFTGVKDMNGVDIYDGDIVNVKCKPYNVRDSVVVWGVKSHGWSLKCEVLDFGIGLPKVKYYGLASGKNLEITGNIHES